jgi:hypothetical protein
MRKGKLRERRSIDRAPVPCRNWRSTSTRMGGILDIRHCGSVARLCLFSGQKQSFRGMAGVLFVEQSSNARRHRQSGADHVNPRIKSGGERHAGKSDIRLDAFSSHQLATKFQYFSSASFQRDKMMPLALLVIGALLIMTGIKGGSAPAAVGAAFDQDVMGPSGFLNFLIGLIGIAVFFRLIDMPNAGRFFLILVLLVFLAQNANVLTALQNVTASTSNASNPQIAPGSTPASPPTGNTQ